ncbi:MAG: deoxyribodipyrimidine photo-lyase [Phycisphaerales bacterium]|nr:MAG: deoxyribodipyrimidine photo-lyase [Phycisphaerales bacterium]
MRTLVWFRRDLRTRDNTALAAAARHADDGVVAVFLMSPKQWREHDEAACKVEFWLRNLRELKKMLAGRNIPLIIETADRFSDVPKTLLRIARKSKCNALHFNREYEVNECRRDEAVIELFEREGLSVASHTDHVIFEPGEVLTGEGKYYGVFTPFKKKYWSMIQEHGINVTPMPRQQKPIDIASSEVPEAVSGFKSSGIDPDVWPGGEDHAKNRLDSFIENRIHSYKDDRDFPAINATSTLSPYLNAGVISPRQCIRAAMSANDDKIDSGQKGIVHWISEVIWREFYQHILVGYPRVSMHRPFRLETNHIQWEDNEEHFQAWCDGCTGYPLVDAAMRQMKEVGWMHNRLRMVAAMFLTKDLFLDWRRGEQFFMRHLVDGDLGSNNGGWQWSASTGTDAAPYFRIFNPISQSRKFDSDGAFIRKYVPELDGLDGKSIHDPSEIPELLKQDLDYPAPIVDHRAARDRVMKAFQAIK